MKVNDINITTREGKLLVAAIATIGSLTNKTPGEVLKYITTLTEEMGK